MLDFILGKTKLQAYDILELPIETFEILGIGQINPYCKLQYDNEIFITSVSFLNDSKDYDEREGLVLAKKFTIKKCPKCKKIELVPTKIRINLNSNYLRHEEEIAFDAYEEHPSFRHTPSVIETYCNHCSSCFEIKIKSKDCWVKEAKKIKTKELITGSWDEYCHE